MKSEIFHWLQARVIKRNGKSLLLYFTLLLLYVTIAQELNKHLLQSESFTEKGMHVYGLLQDSIFSYWIFALFVYFTYRVCKKTLNTESIDYVLYTLGLSIFVLFILWYDNLWEYNKCFAIDLKVWWSIFTSIIICSSLYKGVQLILKAQANIKPSVDNSNAKGFSNDLPLDSQTQKSNFDLTFFTRQEIAKEITERLYRTDVRKEPFAISISGSWGSGKTSFLSYIEDKIQKDKGKNHVIKFSPWDCQTPAQITADFFTLLSQHIDSQVPQLTNLIKDYIALLLSLSTQGNEFASNLTDVIDNYLEEQVSSCKGKISGYFEGIKEPYYIFIDDLDRLDYAEILEVLRIIRNTSKFPNLIFIASLDKQYTTHLLEKSGFENGGRYLEKIFQLEVPLPRIDNFDMLDELRQELRSNIQEMSNKQIESLLIGISNTPEKRKLLNDVLVNFRIAKRLIRQFSISANYLHRRLHEKEYEYVDLFYLEMLRYIDSRLYDRLSVFPEEFFTIETNKIAGRYYVLKDVVGIDQKSNSYSILGFLFSKDRKVKLNRLSVLANYYNYFCLSQPRDSVKIADFQELINNANDDRFDIIKRTIKEWSRSNRRTETTTDSIYHCFISSFDKSKKYTFTEIKPYLLFCLYWASYDIAYQISQVDALSSLLSRNLMKTEDDERLVLSYTKQELAKLLMQKDLDLIHFVWVISRLHRFDTVFKNQIIDNEYVDNLVQDDCFIKLCETQYGTKVINAQELVQDSRPLCRFAKAACVEDKDGQPYSLVIDKIIEYLSHLPQKSIYYYRVIDAFPNVLDAFPQEEYVVEHLSLIFGGQDTVSKYKQYVENCFDKENATKTGTMQV